MPATQEVIDVLTEAAYQMDCQKATISDILIAMVSDGGGHCLLTTKDQTKESLIAFLKEMISTLENNPLQHPHDIINMKSN